MNFEGEFLDSLLDPNWREWYRHVAAVLRGTVRASSAVECMNSVLRMHQSRHRTMTPGMLDVKRLYWNTRAFRGGKRKGKCPYEHLGLKLGACLGISIQVTSMGDQSVQVASIRPQCLFAPIPAA